VKKSKGRKTKPVCGGGNPNPKDKNKPEGGGGTAKTQQGGKTPVKGTKCARHKNKKKQDGNRAKKKYKKKKPLVGQTKTFGDEGGGGMRQVLEGGKLQLARVNKAKPNEKRGGKK